MPGQTERGSLFASATLIQSDGQLLEQGTPLEGELAGGKKHKYFIRLGAQQFARLVVEQHGVDIALRVRAADGTLLARVDDLDETTGSEQVAVVAETEGVYQLEVQAAEEADAGSYLVRLVEVRAPTPQDRLIISAEKFLLDANRLLAERSAESRRLAIKKYEEAAALFQQTAEHGREAFALAQIGMIQGWMGDSQMAQTYFNRALEMQRENHNRMGEARALTGLGQLMSSAGEWQKALNYHQQALALRRTEDDRVGMMVSLDRIGEIYVSLGEWRKALDYYNQALEILSGRNSLRLRAKLFGDVGQVYEALGEREKALEQYERALALRRKRNNQGGVAVMLHRIGLLQASSGQLKTALERYDEALKIQQSLGNIRAAETLTSIGETYYRLGDAPQALSYFERSSTLRGANAATPDEALTRYWLGRVRRDQGDLTGALREIETAVSIVENLRSKIASTELRASYFATVEAYYEFYIDLLMQLQARDPSSSYQEAALGVSERARARSLLELLREARADIRRGADPVLLARELYLHRQLNAKAEEQSNLGDGARAREQAPQLAKELEALTTQYVEVEAQIRATSPRYAALTQPHPLGPKEIQQLLDSQTLLLEYKLGETRSFLWAITPSSIKSFELPKRAEVEAAARHLYELLTERNRRVSGETLEQRQTRLRRAESDYETVAAELSRMLIGPVATLIGDKRLLIVADGALFYIPFAALPAPEMVGSGNEIQKQETASLAQRESPDASWKASAVGKPLIADREIISLPSASVLAALREDKAGRKPSPKLIAVLADPVFDAADVRLKVGAKADKSRRGSSVITPQSSNLAEPDMDFARSELETDVIGPGNSIPRLPFSRREAASILASAPTDQSRVALDFDANREVIIGGELSQYRYIHFATHGLLNSIHPELSGVVLSLVDAQGRRQDGFLRLHEIYNLELPADMVVLSACRTGLGKEVKGEGLVGLTRGFMYAGASRVTASLWKVDDAATAELMGRFYFGMLKKSLTPAAALRQAQIEMAQEKRWHSPYYWAAFILQGDWR